jgi:large subunit ribosomal protein L10
VFNIEENSMTLKLEDKQAIVAEVSIVAKTALSAVIADYRGMQVSTMTKLRARAREQGVYLRVVRNTLAKRAVQETEFACLSDHLVGPLVIAFSKDEPGAAARLFRDFVKETENLKVKALAIGGQVLAASQLDAVSRLPTRNEALATLCRVMLAPAEKLARTLREPYAQVVRVTGAVAEQRKAA